MSKTISGGMTTHLGLNNTTLAKFVKVKQRDGTIVGFSEYDRDFTIDIGDGDGSITYPAKNALRMSGSKSRHDIKIDQFEIVGHLESTAITIQDLRAGVWDDAEYHSFAANYNDVSIGDIPLSRGHFGKVVTKNAEYNIEMLSLINRYNVDLLRTYTVACYVELGSTGFKGVGDTVGSGGCNVQIQPTTWSTGTTAGIRKDRDAGSGNVVGPIAFNDRHFKCSVAGTSGGAEPAWDTTIGNTTVDNSITWVTIQALEIEATVNVVTDNKTFSVTYTGDAPDALLTGGVCEFLTGNNAGRHMEVLTWTLATNDIVLLFNMPETITNGDTLLIRSGCDKTLETCKTTFDNVENFQGFPHIPGLDRLFLVPNAPVS